MGSCKYISLTAVQECTTGVQDGIYPFVFMCGKLSDWKEQIKIEFDKMV